MTSGRHTVAETESQLVGGPRTVVSFFTLSQLQILPGVLTSQLLLHFGWHR